MSKRIHNRKKLHHREKPYSGRLIVWTKYGRDLIGAIRLQSTNYYDYHPIPTTQKLIVTGLHDGKFFCHEEAIICKDHMGCHYYFPTKRLEKYIKSKYIKIRG